MSGDGIRLTMPCGPHYARVARTAVAACGVVEGFSVDELGDVRLLVDEVFVAMYELGVSRVELVVVADHGRLALSIDALGPAGQRRGPADSTFVQTLADIVGRDVRFDLDGTTPSFAAVLYA
ncbi:MAG TPA: hypothetical protein VK549_18145, partial [Acidimicrobiia bacterium]|nr:hypothetical protein [Acidimicrobiia bacterium]